MKFIKILLIAILVFVIAGVVIAWDAGFFTSVDVQEKPMGPFTVVYESHTGDYAQAGAVQMKVYNALLEKGIETTKGFGIYLDNPETVAKAELRSQIGCIVDQPSNDLGTTIAGEFEMSLIPVKDYMVVEFPFKRQLSIFAGIIKAYPALKEHSQVHGYMQSSSMEIYDVPNEKIYYLMELKK